MSRKVRLLRLGVTCLAMVAFMVASVAGEGEGADETPEPTAEQVVIGKHPRDLAAGGNEEAEGDNADATMPQGRVDDEEDNAHTAAPDDGPDAHEAPATREPMPVPDGLPRSFDLRDNVVCGPYVSKVWDQGSCDSCVAMATASALTDRICYKKHKDPESVESQTAVENNEVVSGSPSAMVSCCDDCGGCNGTSITPIANYLREHGLPSEECLTYRMRMCDHGAFAPRHMRDLYAGGTSLPPCKAVPVDAPECELTARPCPRVMHADSVRRFSFGESDEVMQEIFHNGSVVATMHVQRMFYGIKSDDIITEAALRRQKSVAASTVVGRAHAVRIIGWGDAEDGTPYWIGVNSWNMHWGAHGVFRIERGQNIFGIESEVYAFDAVAGAPEDVKPSTEPAPADGEEATPAQEGGEQMPEKKSYDAASGDVGVAGV